MRVHTKKLLNYRQNCPGVGCHIALIALIVRSVWQIEGLESQPWWWWCGERERGALTLVHQSRHPTDAAQHQLLNLRTAFDKPNKHLGRTL